MPDAKRQSSEDLGNLHTHTFHNIKTRKTGADLRDMPDEFLEGRSHEMILLKCQFLIACMLISVTGMRLREFGLGKGLEQLFC